MGDGSRVFEGKEVQHYVKEEVQQEIPAAQKDKEDVICTALRREEGAAGGPCRTEGQGRRNARMRWSSHSIAQERVRVVITCRLKLASTRPLADAQERMVITRWLEKAGLRLLALTAPRSCFLRLRL